jgi:hypothetical protein
LTFHFEKWRVDEILREDPARPMTPHDKRLSLARLQRLAKRLQRSALLARNGDNTATGEARALAFEQDAAALLWACHELGTGDWGGFKAI